jgi:S-adenosyl-L-homocysteine hydrolase, NAD binding domain
MPIVGRVAEVVGEPTLFAGVRCFAVQHLLASTRGLFNVARQLGLQPSSTLLVGKNYSTHADTVRNLRLDGYAADSGVVHSGLPGRLQKPLAESSPSLDGLLDFTTALLKARPEVKQPLLIVDDGAEGVHRWSEVVAKAGVPVAAVEQTRFGARRLREQPPDFPVINVAESPVKLHMESILIGDSVARELTRVIDDLRSQGRQIGSHVCIRGYGAVGRAVAQALSDGPFTMEIIETDPARRALAQKDGFPVAESRWDALSRADIVLGATGNGAFTGADYLCLKDGALLASASSSNIEFGADHNIDLRVKASGVEAHPLLAFHSELDRSPHPSKTFILANSGYPINFTREADPIAAPMIQLTRALLLLGMIQAARELKDRPNQPPQKGLIALDREGQKLIANAFIQTARASSVLSPKLMRLLEEGFSRACHDLDAIDHPVQQSVATVQEKTPVRPVKLPTHPSMITKIPERVERAQKIISKIRGGWGNDYLRPGKSRPLHGNLVLPYYRIHTPDGAGLTPEFRIRDDGEIECVNAPDLFPPMSPELYARLAEECMWTETETVTTAAIDASGLQQVLASANEAEVQPERSDFAQFFHGEVEREEVTGPSIVLAEKRSDEAIAALMLDRNVGSPAFGQTILMVKKERFVREKWRPLTAEERVTLKKTLTTFLATHPDADSRYSELLATL